MRNDHMDNDLADIRSQTLTEPAYATPPSKGPSQCRRPSLPSWRTQVAKGAALNAQLTPPDTPNNPHNTVELSSVVEKLFHNYLRASHPFNPSTTLSADDETSSITVPIQQGDLILVHSVHANGWADGTLLTTGSRGWLPTNYCEPYDHPYIRNLLNAMTQFWDLLGNSEDVRFSSFVRQDYVRGLIAGVRYLLEHADCLHRDAALVLRHIGIRRMRKGLLADLSMMVQKAKELREEASQPYAGEVVHMVLDELIAKAFKVVTRAVKFVDTWTQECASELEDSRLPTIHEPPTPPNGTDALATGGKVSNLHRISPALDPAICFVNDTSQAVTPANTDEPVGRSVETQESARLLSVTHESPSDTVAHRLSLIHPHAQPGGLASERLAQAQDVCISHIGTFIGHHLQCGSASELVETTERVVTACKFLLAIVREVYSHDPQRGISVQNVHLNFQTEVEALVKSTKEIFTLSNSPDDDVAIVPEQSGCLVTLATSLIRTAGECVAMTRVLIEQIGDFSLVAQVMVDDEFGSRESNESASNTSPQDEQDESDSEAGPSPEKSFSGRMPQSPPPLQQRGMIASEATNSALPSPARTVEMDSSAAPVSPGSYNSLPPPSVQQRSAIRDSQPYADKSRASTSFRPDSIGSARKDSIIGSIPDSTETRHSSFRDSGMTVVSEASTRATTPDQESAPPVPGLLNSFNSIASMRSVGTDISSDAESQLLHKTYAHELVLNKEGQVTGGSLPALVEQLSIHDGAPDAQFLTSFYVTFRLFTTPRKLAQALIDRFDYIGNSKTIGVPVRLRVCNVFKGWVETYWNADVDKDALGDIRYFAMHKLKPQLPSAADRLMELTRKVTAAYHSGTITGPLVSGVGKWSTAIGTPYAIETDIPEPTITKSQLHSLRSAVTGGSDCSILDLDPLELARQLTLVASRTFCDIRSDELLSLEWSKKSTVRARNVRSVCKMNTDLAFVVGDTILTPGDAKKRALIVKQWVKVAICCLELNNYESLMAIVVSMSSSTVQRLQRTWEVVSKKTKTRLEELKQVIDSSKNHRELRSRLENAVAPCLPFLGIYLTDLTFVDAGNAKTRELPRSASATGQSVSVINFDKYMRMAKIISHIQRFQAPYKLQRVPEMQAWLESYLQRMREAHDGIVVTFHRRSLLLEPRPQTQDSRWSKGNDGKRDDGSSKDSDDGPKTAGDRAESAVKDRLDMILKNWSGMA